MLPSYALFDFDGVIIDSEPFYIETDRQVISRFGYEPTDEELYTFMGRSSSKMGTALLAAHGINVTIEQYKAARPDPLVTIYDNPKIPAIAGLRELWQNLAEHNVGIGVVSTSLCAPLTAALNRLGLMSFVDVLVGRELVRHTKPHPEPYLKALSYFTANPEDVSKTIAIDDSPSGIASARAAGMYAIGFQGSTVPQALPEADLVVTSHEELAHTLKAWGLR
ncbi:HAD family hydrolase [Olsenella sp. Marseille-QA0557]|uniref:HAD family hydrolase n=1 Tax=Olsenella sp. Marseille-QA0557 TaxID=3378782 RepID=UPI003D12B3C9